MKKHHVFTETQMTVLKAIHKRNPDGSLLDFRQLQTALGGKNRSTLRNILRRMIDWGVVEYTDETRMYPGAGANICRLLRITDSGIDILRPRRLPTAGS